MSQSYVPTADPESDRAPASSGQVERSPNPRPSRSVASSARWAWCTSDAETLIVLVATLMAILYLVVLVADYRNDFVHPDWHQRVLPESLSNGLSIQLNDIINSMQLREIGESRPRWLAYLIVALDQKLRLWLYTWLPVHPTLAPVAWFFQLIVTPYCLYRLLWNITEDRRAVLAGLAVYLSSTGFLSGFTMQFMPGKTLSNTIFIIALYAASAAARTLRPGAYLSEASGAGKYVMLIVLFIGLFVDEMPIAAFAIVPLVFWEYFIPTRISTPRIKAFFQNSLLVLSPAVAFAVFVIVVAPIIIQQFLGFKFDYLGDTLSAGDGSLTGASIIQGRVPLTFGIILENFTTLFGLSLVPWIISPLVTSPAGPFPGSQVNNLPKIVIFLGFFGAIAFVATRGEHALRKKLIGLVIGIAVFIVFLSVLSIRHIPIVTGYYYGAGFASLFALLVAILVKAFSSINPLARLLAVIAAAAIVSVQIINFGPINDGWIVTHNEWLTRTMMQKQPPGLQRRIPLRPPVDLTAGEVRAIWTAWKNNRLDAYLRDGQVSAAAVYEVFELRAIDKARDRGNP